MLPFLPGVTAFPPFCPRPGGFPFADKPRVAFLPPALLYARSPRRIFLPFSSPFSKRLYQQVPPFFLSRKDSSLQSVPRPDSRFNVERFRAANLRCASFLSIAWGQLFFPTATDNIFRGSPYGAILPSSFSRLMGEETFSPWGAPFWLSFCFRRAAPLSPPSHFFSCSPSPPWAPPGRTVKPMFKIGCLRFLSPSPRHPSQGNRRCGFFLPFLLMRKVLCCFL